MKKDRNKNNSEHEDSRSLKYPPGRSTRYANNDPGALIRFSGPVLGPAKILASY
jgi:hypothetical protein